YGHSAVVYKNFMYIFGGRQIDNNTNLLFQIDLTKDPYLKRINHKGDIPPPTTFHTAVVHENAMYVLGGSATDDLFRYTFSTYTWERLKMQNEIPKLCSDHSAVIFGDYMFVFAKKMYQVDLRNLISYEVKATGDKPPKRSLNHTSVVYGNSLFIFGGWNLENDCCLNDLHELKLSSKGTGMRVKMLNVLQRGTFTDLNIHYLYE